MHTDYAITLIAASEAGIEHKPGVMHYTIPVPRSHVESEILPLCHETFPSTAGWQNHTITIVPLSQEEADAFTAERGYFFSLLAFNGDEQEVPDGASFLYQDLHVGNKAFFVEAPNAETATRTAEEKLLRLFPADEGWLGHTCTGRAILLSRHLH